MLDLTFYDKKNQIVPINVPEDSYRKLAEAGLAKIVNYNEYKVIIEDDEYEINAAELNYDTRKKFLWLIDEERQRELDKLFKQMDSNPTIKEIRDNFRYIKILTEMYSLFKDENNMFFSYE